MKELKVYLISPYLWDKDDLICDLSDSEFMDKAEFQGTVYSLAGFVDAYNNERVDTINTFIRIL